MGPVLISALIRRYERKCIFVMHVYIKCLIQSALSRRDRQYEFTSSTTLYIKE